jgi:histidyl-tRNA synthetase
MAKAVLVYDVPTDEKGTYAKIRSKIGRYALRINLSVWLLDFGNRDKVKALIDKIHEDGSRADMHILKFDESAEPELMEMAKEALRNQIENIRAALSKRMKDLTEQAAKAEEDVAVISAKRRASIQHAKRELAIAKTLAFTFNITHDVDDLLQVAVKDVATQMSLVDSENCITIGCGK